MANTYTQLYTHYVFAVQDRHSLIQNVWQEELFKYITGIVEKQESKLYVAGGVPDHIHLLVSMNPKQAPSDLMYHIKRSSSLWINENGLAKGRFAWQEGFGAFSCNKKQIPITAGYIINQPAHHKKKSFLEEYKGLLDENGILFDEKYIFKTVEG
ncbi:MAG: IS200/IS605 family transposase [Bacteroidota bacterium]